MVVAEVLVALAVLAVQVDVVARVAQATRASSAAAAGRRRHAVLPHMVLGRSATEAAAVWQS